MTTAVIILSLLLALSLTGNVLITRQALKINRTLHAGGQAVEQYLDLLDVSYGIVGRILQMPLASNDNKVIQIHKELKRVHANLLVVAARLAHAWNHDENNGATGSETEE